APSWTVRCFVALDLPDDVRAALERTQASLRREAPRADLRWVAPAGLHVTLKFLGEVPEAALAPVADAVRTTAAAHAGITLALAGLGGFPSLARPRVLWAGIPTGVAEVGRLAAALERVLEPLGFPPESRPFRSHVTIARVRSPRGLGRIRAAIELALSQMEKQFGKGAIMRLGEAALAGDIPALPTGSLGLDIALGIGGIPRGRVVEIYGPESSGKTTLALQLVAEGQKRGGIC